MKKKIIEITSLRELMEMSSAGASTGYGTNAFKEIEEGGAGQTTVTPAHFKPKGKDMRQEIQTEMMMRKYIRGKIKKQLNEQAMRETEQEYQLRLVIRGLINEAKEMANPHPNTGINKLRDAFRKAKPTLKAKFQQLTSTSEQRETFTSHMLRAFVRLFDELDALQAQGEIQDEIGEIESAVGSLAGGSGLEAPPPDQEADDIEDEIDDLLETILREVQVDIEDEGIDVVTDEEKADQEKEAEASKSQTEKDFNKKKEKDSEKTEFGGELEGDTTGRNQAFDAFRLVQSYFSDAYLDLANADDQKMYRDWCLYNLKLLFQNFEESLPQAPDQPAIENPEGV
jgi:hypothetical protein